MKNFIIYFIGYILSLFMTLYNIIEVNNNSNINTTLGDLMLCLLIALLSWLNVITHLLMYIIKLDIWQIEIF
jgi:hypothetical protein